MTDDLPYFLKEWSYFCKCVANNNNWQSTNMVAAADTYLRVLREFVAGFLPKYFLDVGG